MLLSLIGSDSQKHTMTSSADRQAFLIVTPQLSKPVLKLYHQLQKATAGLGDVFILYHSQDGAPPVPDGPLNIDVFTNDVLTNMGYTAIKKTLVPGSNHFPVLNFYLKHPEYKYYWCIEDDVTFNGKWKDFFSTVSPTLTYGFISSHIRSYSDIPRWYWWDSLTTPDSSLEKKELLHSFNPIYRISDIALNYLDLSLKNGCAGHHEVLMPSILRKAGFTIADFGNKENNITPCLSLCTLRSMRWKPVFLVPGTRKNTLYHPVKPKITFDQLYVYFKRTLQNRKKYFT
jgi:hypothetical protein